jgi:acetyl-CoA carboxylase biotin carboxyl carrier protein
VAKSSTSNQKKGKTASSRPGAAKAAEASASAMGLDLSQLERVLSLMSGHRVSELEWETTDVRLVLRTGDRPGVAAPAVLPAPAAATIPHVPAPAVPAAPVAPVAPPAAPAPVSSNTKQVTSPFVGTFYRSPSPTADPYVRDGQRIKRGQVLCIIEAMKLMNEIESEIEGKVVSVLVENGQPVEFGEPLFLVEV